MELNKKQKQTIILYSIYIIALLVIFRNVFIANYVDSFLRLFGFKSRWYVYNPNNLPVTPGGELPSYPTPDWDDVPIVTTNYWQMFFNSAFRFIIIIVVAWVLYKIILWIIKRYDYKSTKQTTLFYKVYTDTIKTRLDLVVNQVKTFGFEMLQLILDKKNTITMGILVFIISGWMPVIIVGLFQSMWDLFVLLPGTWTSLHIKAIVFGLYKFISSFNAVNILVIVAIIYIITSFIFAYMFYDKNEIQQEELVDQMPVGVNVVGRSGAGKTRTLQTLASASQRNAKKKIKKYLEDNESAFGRIVDFNVVRYYYNKNKSKLKNSIDCENLAMDFIKEHQIDCIQVDRFLGQTPNIHVKLKWHFVGMWLIDKRKLVLSTLPMIINDNSMSDEVRNDVWDLLTRRHEDSFALKFNLNAVKRTMKNLMGKVDQFNNLVITPQEELDARKSFAESNFSLEPGITLVLPELDKDFHNSERKKIILDGSDKLFAVIRHFIAFDSLSIGHVFFDAQQQDGVANVVRGRFDYMLYLTKATQKRSLFFVPYIIYLESRIKMWSKIRELTNEYSPFKKSFFRIFVAWRLQRLTRLLDYFQSFSYIQTKARPSDSTGDGIGEKEITINLNLATTFYQYASTQYQSIYQTAKRNKASFRYEHLKTWTGLEMSIQDAVEIHSDFVDSIIGIERPKQNEDVDQKNLLNFDEEIKQMKGKKKIK